jgi:CRISPR-associated endonuclease/helicase Cas3
MSYWCGLEDHLRDAQAAAVALTQALRLPPEFADAVVQAAALHDLGKAHPEWQRALPAPGRLPDNALGELRAALNGDLFAKTPHLLAACGSQPALAAVATALAAQVACVRAGQPARGADGGWSASWSIAHKLNRDELDELRELDGVTRVAHVQFRPGLRHEAVTALAMWSRHRSGDAPWPALAVYLAAAHHGKVRTTMHSRPSAVDNVCGVPRADGEIAVKVLGQNWPLDFTVAVDGAVGEWSEEGFVLTGHGWTGLVADLLGSWRGDDREPWRTGAVPDGQPRGLGPFRLAYLEALVRIADWRASDAPTRMVAVVETPT